MPSERAPTSDRLRRDIDSSRAGDKVDFPDPAAAPLGADDEAAGRPPSAAERKLAVRQESHTAPAPRGKSIWPLFMVVVVALIVVAALAALLLAGGR